MEREAYRAMVTGSGWEQVADDGANVLAHAVVEGAGSVYCLGYVGAQEVRRVDVVVYKLYREVDGYAENAEPDAELVLLGRRLPMAGVGIWTPGEAAAQLVAALEAKSPPFGFVTSPNHAA